MKTLCTLLLSVFILVPSFSYANAINVWTEMNSLGASIAAWETHTGSDTEIAAATQNSSGVWSAATILTNPSVCIDSRDPKTAIDVEGNVVVVWIGLDTTLLVERLFGSMLLSGTWTFPQAISTTTEIVTGHNFEVNIFNGAVTVNWSAIMTLTFQQQVRSMYSPVFGTWSGVIVTVGT